MRNAGRYPDRDSALAHLQLAQNRLNEVSLTDPQVHGIIDPLVANYVTPSQVDAEVAAKLSKSALAADANNYIDQSQVGVNYASLVSGSLPASQRPSSPRALYLEAQPVLHYNNPTNTNTATSVNKVSIGSFTIPDPLYAWLPIIYASFEINIISGSAPAIITVEDSSNRVVAGGMSSQAPGLNRINISPEELPTTYLGSLTLTFRLRLREGTGQIRPTKAYSTMSVLRAPWTNK